MRIDEFKDGIVLTDKNGKKVGESTSVAWYAIPAVVCSRVGMAIPHMVLTPAAMTWLEKYPTIKARPWLNAPIQTSLCGLLLLFSTPLCCAFFPQESSISVDKLESEVKKKIQALPNPPSIVYYNKGL